MAFVLLSLSGLSEYNFLKSHPFTCKCYDSFLFTAEQCSLRTRTTFSLSVVSEHLGEFCVLELVNTAAMNMALQVCLKYDVKSLGVSQGVLKLGHRLVLFLAF